MFSVVFGGRENARGLPRLPLVVMESRFEQGIELPSEQKTKETGALVWSTQMLWAQIFQDTGRRRGCPKGQP